jgi:hypothetical protein
MNEPPPYREILPGRTAMRLVLLALLIAVVLAMLGWFLPTRA